MSQQLKLPELGENIESGTVLKVLVSPGDRITRDQNVLELETEKAVAEVPSDIEGVVEEIHVEVGDEVEVGQLLMTLRDGAKGAEEEGEERKTEQGEGKTEARREREAEQGKGKTGARREEEAEQGEGKTEARGEREADQGKGKAGARREEEGEEGEGRTDSRREAVEEKKAGAPLPAAPSVRRRARELDVDLRRVRGSGPGGRISEQDVEDHGREGKEPRPARHPALPDFARWGEIESQPMSKIRRLTADGMSTAWANVPHAVQFGKADIAAVEVLRDRYQAAAERAGGRLSLTVVLVKTLAGALKAFPRFNASVDEENDAVVYRKYVHIGVAAATDRGLVVPVVRDVERKSMLDLSIEIPSITKKARDGKLAVDDMQGGCMTLTNGGALGGDLFIPIVNWPEAAILGVARTVTEAAFESGVPRPKRVLPLSLSYDHRLIDGADAIAFVNWIVQALEDPFKLVWEA